MSGRETYSEEGPQCPICERQFAADEPCYYSDRYTEQTCDECGETFDVVVYTSTSWTCTERPTRAAPVDRSGEAGETREAGLDPKGESAVPEGQAPKASDGIPLVPIEENEK